jgi:hypothetical protein
MYSRLSNVLKYYFLCANLCIYSFTPSLGSIGAQTCFCYPLFCPYFFLLLLLAIYFCFCFRYFRDLVSYSFLFISFPWPFYVYMSTISFCAWFSRVFSAGLTVCFTSVSVSCCFLFLPPSVFHFISLRNYLSCSAFVVFSLCVSLCSADVSLSLSFL